MKAQPPNRFPMPGRPLVALNPRCILSNIVTCIVSANHHPTSIRDLSDKVMDTWFSEAIRFIIDGRDQTQFQTMFSESQKEVVRSPALLFLRNYAPVIASMLIDPQYVRDAGEEMKARLLETGDWEELWVTSPSLGSPRSYMSFKYELEDNMPLFGTSLGSIQEIKWSETRSARLSPDSLISTTRVQSALARTCYTWDRVFMGDSLVPDASSLTKRDYREQLMGSAQAALRQQQHMTSVPLLYLLQYAAFWPRLMRKTEDYALDMAAVLYERDKPSLDLRRAIRTSVLNRIPLHPLLAIVASAFDAPLSLSTYFGTHEALIVPTGIHLPDNVAGGQHTRSSLAQLALTAALNEQYRLSSLALNAASNEWLAGLLSDISPNVDQELAKKQASIVNGTGYAALAEDLAAWSRFVTLFPDVARQLGWSNPTALHLDQVETAGANFALTDGDWYSVSPVNVLVGLTPSLPIINPRVNGLARRYQSDFNTGPNGQAFASGESGIARIHWSTLTVKPFHTALEGDEALAQFYIPAGMCMGEAGGESRFSSAEVSDPVGVRVARFFQRASPGGYVRIYASSPSSRVSRVAANLRRLYTDWEMTVESPKDPEGAQSELLEAYGSNNVDAQHEMLLYRDSWRMRVPVQMSHDATFTWLTELGQPSASYPFDGNVVFDDDLKMPHDGGSIDALVNLLPISVPKLPDTVDKPVTSPEK